MSAVVQTQDCYPTELVIGTGPDRLVLPAPEPHHEACSGGQRLPGVLGGWHCPCPCHSAAAALSPAHRTATEGDDDG